MTWLAIVLAVFGVSRVTTAMTRSDRLRWWCLRRWPSRSVPKINPVTGREDNGTAEVLPALPVRVLTSNPLVSFALSVAAAGGLHGAGLLAPLSLTVLAAFGIAGAASVACRWV